MTAKKLHVYQNEMKAHINTHKRAGLFAPMGSGKTATVLTAVADEMAAGTLHGPVLVLAPLRVARATWPSEALIWTPHLSVVAICGTPEERTAALETPADIYTTNYENIEWLVAQFETWPFTMIVADEWTRLKSFRGRQGGKRAAALAKVAFESPRFVGLTGTPAPNGLLDLWGQLYFIDRGERLGRAFYQYATRFFHKDFSGFKWVLHDQSAPTIHGLIADVCMTVNMAGHLDVRQPVFNRIYVDLPRAAQRIYRAMENEFFAEVAGEAIEAKNAAVKSVKLLQLANGAVYTPEAAEPFSVVHDEKLDALESLIEEQNGAPLLVAYYLKSDLARLKKRFPKAREMDANPQTVVDFNAGKIEVLFIHPASAGHGLSLHRACNTMAFFGFGWSLENYQQVIERIGPTRQAQAGFDRPVFIHLIIARNTVDEMVLERLETKADVQEVLINALKRRGLKNVATV